MLRVQVDSSRTESVGRIFSDLVYLESNLHFPLAKFVADVLWGGDEGKGCFFPEEMN